MNTINSVAILGFLKIRQTVKMVLFSAREDLASPDGRPRVIIGVRDKDLLGKNHSFDDERALDGDPLAKATHPVVGTQTPSPVPQDSSGCRAPIFTSEKSIIL